MFPVNGRFDRCPVRFRIHLENLVEATSLKERTLMVIHALRQPPSQAKDDLLAVLGKGENVTAEQVALGHQALHDLGSIEYAKAKAESYHRKARLPR